MGIVKLWLVIFGGALALAALLVVVVERYTSSRQKLRWEQGPNYKAGKKRGAEWARERQEDEPERVKRVARLNVDPSYEEVAAARVQEAAYPDDPPERAAERLWGRGADGNVIKPDLPFVDAFVGSVREVAPLRIKDLEEENRRLREQLGLGEREDE